MWRFTIPAILFLLLILQACQKEGQQYEIEDRFYQCFKEQYLAYGIDISKSIDSANQVLLANDVLSEISGESFMSMLVVLNQNNRLPYNASDELINQLEQIKYLPRGIGCSDSSLLFYDSTKLMASKLSNFLTIFDKVAKSGDVSMEFITREFMAVFTAEDFDHPLYSTFGTLAIYHLTILQKDRMGITAILPPKPDKGVLDSYVIMELKMKAGDKLHFQPILPP